MTREVVYLGASNRNAISVRHDRVLMPMDGVTRIVVAFEGVAVVADSEVDDQLIQWGPEPGRITFGFGGLLIAPGVYNATVRVFDAAHPDGQILVHGDHPLAPRDQKLAFEFIDPAG